jgi:hypothetical protein
MKLFECQNCGQRLYFENTRCVYFENTRCASCGLSLGYLPANEVVSALEEVRVAGAR